MLITQEQTANLLGQLYRYYPSWTGFDDSDFVVDEIMYKEATVRRAADLINREALIQLMEAGAYEEYLDRIDQIGRESHLLSKTGPASGDLAIIHVAHLDRPVFCRRFFDLLYGEDDAPERLNRYLAYVRAEGLPNKWTFPTYFLFFCYPETEIFVRPSIVRHFLRLLGSPIRLGRPSAETYAQLRQFAHRLRDAFEGYGIRDMLEIQSLIRMSSQIEPLSSSTSGKKARFEALFERFYEEYASTSAGKEHASLYEASRHTAGQNFDEIKAAFERGEDVTDRVLLQLLPHMDTAPNRESGAWISVAPVITSNVKNWFERAGWVKSSQWPDVAGAVFRFIQSSVENPEVLPEACRTFSQSRYSKGLQTGILTPILHALRPDDYLIINHRPQKVLNYFTGAGFSTAIDGYPAINEAGLQFIREMSPVLHRYHVAGVNDLELFDLFCFWLVDKSGFDFAHLPENEPVPGIVSDPARPYVVNRGMIHRAGYERNEEYNLEECANETGYDPQELERWLRAVERKKQLILYGPPGTGKTYLAGHLARLLISGSDGFVETVQFHPAYTYEDFVQGIRPVTRGDGQLDYPMVPGRFLEFCRNARTRSGRCVLIIDEISRANLSQVFGELMYLLEYRDTTVSLAGGERFYIPPNVRIIGTMNTADRSIALVDFALRRRFAFVALHPRYEILRRFHTETGFPVNALIEVLKKLNEQIGNPHYELGITYFLRSDLDEHLEDIWQLEIEPYLEEYFFDQPQKLASYRWETIRERLTG